MCRVNNRVQQGIVVAVVDGGKSLKVRFFGDGQSSSFEREFKVKEVEIVGAKKNLKQAKSRLWIYGEDRKKVKGKPVQLSEKTVTLQIDERKTVSISLDQLSVFDKKYLSKFARTDLSPENPNPADTASRSATIMLAPVRLNLKQKGKEIKVASATDWKLEIDPQSNEKSKAKDLSIIDLIEILPVTSQPEILKRFLFAESAQWIASQHTVGRDKQTTTLLQISEVGNSGNRRSIQLPRNGDLRTFKEKHLITTNQTDIDVWSLEGLSLRHIKSWRIGNPLEWVHDLGNNLVATYDRYGYLCVWNWMSGRTVFYAKGQPFSVPAISGGKRFIVLPTDYGAALLQIENGQLVGSINVEPQRNATWAFSPDGQSLARSVSQNLSIWSVRDGLQTDDLFQKGVGSESLTWIDNKHILVDNRCLLSTGYDFEVWRFNKDLTVGQVGRANSDYLVYSLSKYFKRGTNSFTLVPWKVLDRHTIDEIEIRAKKSKKVLQAGMDFRLDFTELNLSADDRATVIRDVKNKCRQNGFVIDPKSDNVIRVAAVKTKEDFAVYQSRAIYPFPIRFTPHRCTVEISVGKNVVWKIKRDARPGMFVFLQRNETLEDYAKRACIPSAIHFLSIQIPKNYFRLPFGRDYLGSSRITSAGIIPDNE